MDIHILLKEEGREFFGGKKYAIKESIIISQRVKDLYYVRNVESYHLPRTQLIYLNKLLMNPNFVFPRKQDVHIIFGKFLDRKPETDDFIRQVDRKNILDLGKYLENLPFSMVDRMHLMEYWSLIRRLCYLVSPTPVRLLTQLITTDPQDIWNWNRTKIVQELDNLGLGKIADAYRNYYLSGWKMFLSDFTSTKDFLDIIHQGYYVLLACFKCINSD